MTAATFDRALAVALWHERRRRQPLPPLADLADDTLASVRAEEARRAGEKLNAIIERARSV